MGSCGLGWMCQALHAESSRNLLEIETKKEPLCACVRDSAGGLCERRSRVSLSSGSGWVGGARGSIGLQEGKWRVKTMTPVPDKLLSLSSHDRMH